MGGVRRARIYSIVNNKKLLIPVRNGEQFQIPPETLREVNSGSQALPLPNEDWQGIERRASFGFAC